MDSDFRAFADRALAAGFYSEELLAVYDADPAYPTIGSEAVVKLLKSASFSCEAMTAWGWYLVLRADDARTNPVGSLQTLWQNYLIRPNEFGPAKNGSVGIGLLLDAANEVCEYPGDLADSEQSENAATKAWQAWNDQYAAEARRIAVITKGWLE